MKLGILAKNFYKNQNIFFDEFIKTLKENHKDIILNIYKENPKNIIIDQILDIKNIINDKNDFLISFDDTKSIFYNKNVILIISNLEKIFYPELKNTKFFNKYLNNFIYKTNIKKSKILVCYTNEIKKNLNEKLNIKEEKIKVIPAFFYKSPEITSKIDIKAKHSINGDYLIYDSGLGNSKNIKKLLLSLKELKTNFNLVFIGNEISNDIEIRQLIIELNLKNNIIFAGNPLENELGAYYKQSIGVIYTNTYNDFPINLSNAINYNCNIIANKSEILNEIFEDNIVYFSTNSTNDMIEKIKSFISKGKKEINYDKIKQKYRSINFVNNLINLIKSYE